MSVEKKIEGLEYQLKRTKEAAAYGEDVRKLVEHPLFRKVIIEGFTTQEAARYIQQSGDPMLSDRERADALAIAQAGGHLKRWIAITLQMADSADGNIHALEQELDYVRSQPETENDE